MVVTCNAELAMAWREASVDCSTFGIVLLSGCHGLGFWQPQLLSSVARPLDSGSKQVLSSKSCARGRSGCDGKACTFSSDGKAKCASREHDACIWCRPAALEEECLIKTKRGALIKQFKVMSGEQQTLAKEHLTADYLPLFVAAGNGNGTIQGHGTRTKLGTCPGEGSLELQAERLFPSSSFSHVFLRGTSIIWAFCLCSRQKPSSKDRCCSCSCSSKKRS